MPEPASIQDFIALDYYTQDIVSFDLEANGFLRHMVRNIVGTLVEGGRGKLNEEEFVALLAARDRKRAGMTAPARGLCLVEVRY